MRDMQRNHEALMAIFKLWVSKSSESSDLTDLSEGGSAPEINKLIYNELQQTLRHCLGTKAPAVTTARSQFLSLQDEERQRSEKAVSRANEKLLRL